MAQQTAEPQTTALPEHVSEEEYLEQYAHRHMEWVEGRLIPLSPATRRHDRLTTYLLLVFEAYFSIRPIGEVRKENFVLRFTREEPKFGEPDLMVILDDNPNELTETMMIGTPDVVVEVVSEESQGRDYGEKRTEYEAAGVPEYWLIDPLASVAEFHRLGDDGLYDSERMREGMWKSEVLPGLRVDVSTFWQEDLPDLMQVAASVRAMLGE